MRLRWSSLGSATHIRKAATSFEYWATVSGTAGLPSGPFGYSTCPSRIGWGMAMMPHAHLVESKIAQDAFGSFNHAQFLRRNRLAIRDSRTQAGHLRFLSSWQAECGGKLANLRLGESCLFQRSANLELCGRFCSGPKITHITGIFAIRNDSGPLLPRQRQ